MKKCIHKSQNILEHSLILAAMSCFPVESRPLLILDRGYARVALFIHLREEGIPFLCRAKRSVMVYLQGREKAKHWAALRSNRDRSVVTQFFITPEKGTPGSGHLFWERLQGTLVLIGSFRDLSDSQEIVDLYAKRMSIEQGFRDWKTHLGVRGLIFYGVNPALA